MSREEVAAEAERLWRELRRGAVVWLSGELGSGKTTLVQAVTRAAGAEPARSPTFSLVHEYPSPDGLIVHVDCYRLRHPAEALDLDLPALERKARLVFVEWPERAGAYCPPPDLWLRLAHTDDPDRRIVERVT